MDKKTTRIIAMMIVLGIIAVTIILVMAVFLVNKKIQTADINKKKAEVPAGANVPTQERLDTITETKIIKDTGTDKIPTNFKNVNYTETAKYQFKEIGNGDDYLELKFKNGPIFKIKLFNKISPNICKELEELSKTGKLNNLISGGCTFADLHIGYRDPYKTIFSKPYIDDINYNLVPYKGALITEIITDEKGNYIKNTMKIVLDNLSPDDETYLNNYNFPEALKTEAKNRGGKYYREYLQNVVIGQMVGEIDKLEEYITNVDKTQKTTEAEGVVIEIEYIKYIKNSQ